MCFSAGVATAPINGLNLLAQMRELIGQSNMGGIYNGNIMHVHCPTSSHVIVDRGADTVEIGEKTVYAYKTVRSNKTVRK